MVTGSHSPADYQGIKLRMADGGVGSDDFYEELQRIIDSDPTLARGAIAETDFLTRYLDHLYAMVDTEAIAAAQLRVVYDPLYGSASGCFADLPVSYTHLDVYKRQTRGHTFPPMPVATLSPQ